jgi:hypothetical protein
VRVDDPTDALSLSESAASDARASDATRRAIDFSLCAAFAPHETARFAALGVFAPRALILYGVAYLIMISVLRFADASVFLFVSINVSAQRSERQPWSISPSSSICFTSSHWEKASNDRPTVACARPRSTRRP